MKRLSGGERGVVQFLFDYVSPYSYLASTQVRALAARHARDVEPVPVLFAAMLNAVGTRGPGEVPAKREYMFRDVERIARTLGVPIEPPATHPFNPLTALRVTGGVPRMQERWRLVEALFAAAWVRGLPIDQPETVASIASEVGAEGTDLLARATSPESKEHLREVTQEAIALGVFGVPTMLVDGEMFWGVDSLPLLDRFLGGERPLDAERLARWRALVPSATRKA
jgi:2-hydroxychromene-2-carboxylate isomerase